MAQRYVATTGNDTTGDGTLGNPWLTLTKAETGSSDGDTVNIGAGTFQEATYLTAAKQIAWVGAGAGVTLVRGNNSARVIYLNSTKTKSFTAMTIDGLSSGTVPGYLIEGSGVNQATTFSNCGLDNARTTALRLNSGMNGVTLSYCTMDCAVTSMTTLVNLIGGNNAFTMDNCTVTIPTGLVMSAVIYQAGVATAGQITITNNNITLLSNYAMIRFIGGGVISPIISGNTFTVGTNNTRAILEFLNIVTSCTISGNAINIPGTSTATIPIQLRSTVGTGPDCIYTIEDNVIETHNADNYGFLLGDEGGDIVSKANAFNGSFVRRNILRFAPYFGLAIGNAHGIMMGGNRNIFFEDNYLYGAAYCSACKGHGEAWTDGYIRNNLFVNCTYPVRMKGQSSIRCVNNVIYNDGSQAGTSLSVTENGVGEDSDNAFLRNNLCIRDADKVYEFTDTSFATVDTDYNGFYLTGTGTMGTKFPSVSYSTLAEWQAGAVQDLHSVSGNPLTLADFTVAGDSICFEAGIPVTGVTAITDTTRVVEITLAGNAALVTNSPYKRRSQV
jgi:hypothetical protein